MSVLALGFGAGRSPAWAIGLASLALAISVALRFRGAPVVVVLAAAYGYPRLGPASASLSVADGVLLVGALAALPFVPWESIKLRRILVGLLAYEGLLALAVLGHPTSRAVVEWGHRILLVGGALCVGGALARTGRIGRALRLYLGTSAIVSVAACGFALTHGLTAAYPLGIQKNDAGLLLALAFLITVVAPDSAGLRARLVNPLRLIVVLGLLSTQSRGPMLAVIAVLAMQQFRSHRSRRGFVIVVAAAVAMGGVTLAVTEGQLHRAQVNPTSAKFFGIGAREATYKQALSLWSTHRLLGAGLRYFRDPTLATSEPHDVVIETLAESGVVGLLALSVLLMQAALALRRVPGELATLARYALVVQFIAGSFDIYWVAGRGSFPWVLVGMALGAHSVVTPSAAPSRVPGAA